MGELLEARRLMHAGHAGDEGHTAPVVASEASRAGAIFVDVGNLQPFVDATGVTTWAPDTGFVGGKRVRGKLSVVGTDDDQLFATRRLGNFTYTLPAADGRYTLSLLFVDTVKKPGKRLFDVDAEGQRIETGLDIVARAGRRAMLVVTHGVTVAGGALDLAFTGAKGKAVLSGLALVPPPAGELPPSSPGIPIAPAPTPPGAEPAIKWSVGPTAPTPRVEAGGIQVGGKLYIWGGYTGRNGYDTQSRMDVLDLATQTWSPRRPSPAPPTHAALATDGRFIYAAGGEYGRGIPGTPSADVWRYDTRDDTWTSEALPDLPELRLGSTMSLLDNKLYFFAGLPRDRVTVVHDLWVLDLANVSAGWVAKAPLPKGLSGDHLSSALVDGKIYAVGGEHGHAASEDDDAPYIQHDLLMAYDPATDAWTRKADLPQASSHAESGTLVIDGKIVVFGGQIDDIKVIAAVRAYDPASDTWSALTPLPERRKGGVAGYLDGKVFYTGGQRDGDFHVSTTTWVGTLEAL